MDSPPTREIRKFNVDSIAPKNIKHPEKTKSRLTLEISLLVTIALSLGFLGVKDILLKPACDTRLPEVLHLRMQLDWRTHIFRQEIAIQNLTTMLKAHSGLTAMSFVGGCGTGKSLTVKTMAQQYPEDSVHAYNWQKERNSIYHVESLQDLLLSMPACEPQLVVVDNLSWEQKPYIEDMHRWLKGNSKLKGMNVIIVFVFNLDRYGETPLEGQQEEQEMIGELQSGNLIRFKSFQESDAMDYLVQMRDQNKATQFDSTQLELIIENANVPRYGLKRLANKFQTVE